MCLGVGLELMDNGNIEELFLHEGGHVSIDWMFAVPMLFTSLQCSVLRRTMQCCLQSGSGREDWLCAQQTDRNFISSYAKEHPNRQEDTKYKVLEETIAPQLDICATCYS